MHNGLLTRSTLAGLGVTLALGGCSASVSTGDNLDNAKAQDEISKAVRVQAGVPVKDVSCPNDVKLEKGGRFTCTVTAKDGTKGQVQVVQKDENGNVRFDAPFIHMDEAEGSIVEQINAQVKNIGEVTVDCPDIVVGKPGAPFTCKGTVSGDTFTVNAVQTDGKGKFDFKTTTP